MGLVWQIAIFMRLPRAGHNALLVREYRRFAIPELTAVNKRRINAIIGTYQGVFGGDESLLAERLTYASVCVNLFNCLLLDTSDTPSLYSPYPKGFQEANQERGKPMGTNNIVFLELIEWFDETGKELVHRIPEQGSGEIKFGAQLIVRESQAGVLFYKGKACDAFGPGRHTLKTANIPVLTKMLALPWAMNSPLRAETYLVNMKVFPNLKWGTRDPVAFKDSELGLIRLRAHGIFNVQVVQPVLFINSLVGTMGKYTTQEIEDYLKRVIVSRLNDYLGDNLDSLFNLPGKYEMFSSDLQRVLQNDFSHFGLGLRHLYITSITPPAEVQAAIDDKSRLAVIQDLDRLVKMKAAMAMEKASESPGDAGSGLGMGLGFMMPAMFAEALSPRPSGFGDAAPDPQAIKCPDCNNPIDKDARFCPLCGHQQLVFGQCVNCGKNLPPHARFCSQCGHPADEKAVPKFCPHCSTENLPGSVFCNQCGEKLA
jgi:membrane protease subunit (stomatin/prohibitin family)